MITFLLNLLGAFEFIVDEKPITGFRSNKVRGLLAYLALEGGRPHQRRSLASMFWPEYTDAASMANLRKTLHYLRQDIDRQAPGTSESLLSITQHTIQLNPAGLTVDAVRLEQLLAEVELHTHRHLRTCDYCRSLLAEAVALYRDDLLNGFDLTGAAAFEEWLLFKREQLQRQVVNALRGLAFAHEGRGEFERAEKYAARFATLDPYNEEAHRQLMRILVKDGRRGAALAVYEHLTNVLQTELGVAPEKETEALFRRIRENNTLEAAGSIAQMHHFPSYFTPFVGRKAELSQIKEMLSDPDNRLLAILGVGGIGKTRLAIEAARSAAAGERFVDGIYFAGLDIVATADALPAALVDALGLVFHGSAASESQLLDFLRTRKCLIVLDNFEHLSEGTNLLAEMLNRAPGLVLLVTSRQPLNLRAERQLRIGGLDYPRWVSASMEPAEASQLLSYNAVSFFAQAARLVRPGFTVSPANAVGVVRVCSLVQGMPLALEIAAAWTRLMEPEAIAETIERSLDSLASPLQDIPSRHRSMTSVFDYSWSMLTPAEQMTLAQASVFRGPFSLKTALAVTETTVNHVAALLDKSLLQRTTGGRYELHELLRQYAARQLAMMDKGKDIEQVARRRHSDYYLKLLADALPDFYGPQPRLAASVLQKRLGNVMQAWQWALDHNKEPERLQAISSGVDGLGRFFDFLGLFQEGTSIMSRAAERIEALSTTIGSNHAAALASHLLTWQAHFENKLNLIEISLRTVEKALALGANDPKAAARAKSLKGKLLPDVGQFDQAEACLQEALAYFQGVGDRRSTAQALGRLGVSQWRQGSYHRAVPSLKQALSLQTELGNKRAMAELNRVIAGTYFEQGQLSQAQKYVQRARQLYEESDDVFGVARTAGNLALLYKELGQYDLALEFNRQDMSQHQNMGDRRNIAFVIGNRASIYLEMGELEEASGCYQQAIELLEGVGFAWGVALHQAGLALIWHEKGDKVQALALYEKAISVLREHGARLYVISPLQEQAEILLEQGYLAEAQALNQESLKLAEMLNLPEKIFNARVLAARLDFAQGNKQRARRQLAEILAGSGDQVQQAGLHYELWRMEDKEEHALAARALYRQLNERLPRYAYQSRLDKLLPFAAGQSPPVRQVSQL